MCRKGKSGLLWQALLIALISIATGNARATAPTPAQLDQARIAGLAWLMTHQSGDGSWKDAGGVSVPATSAAITALLNAGIRQGYPFSAALSYLQNAQPGSVDALARQIITLDQVGVVVVPKVALLNQWQNGKHAWGAYRGYGSSLPDTPLAMSALFQTNAYDTANSYSTLCSGLLYAERSDNSFSYLVNGTDTPASQSSGNLVPTAYAAIALDATPGMTGWSSITCYRLENGAYVPATFTLSTVVDNAVSWMLGQQSATDGGFGDAGLGYTHTPVPGTYHEVVILTDTVTGEQFATRAGPESQGFSGSASNSSESSSGGSVSASSGEGSAGGFGFGEIVAQYGTFDQTFRDPPDTIVTYQDVGIIGTDFSESVAHVIEFSNVTNNNDLPYFPLGPNSNSYASTFIESLIGSRPEPIMLAPGYSMGSPDSSLSYKPTSLINAGGGYTVGSIFH